MGRKKSESAKRDEFKSLVATVAGAKGEDAVLKTIASVPRCGQQFGSVAALNDAVDGVDVAPLEPALRSAYQKALRSMSNGSNDNGKKAGKGNGGNKYDDRARARKLLDEAIDHVGERNVFHHLSALSRTTIQNRTYALAFIAREDDPAQAKYLRNVVEKLKALKRLDLGTAKGLTAAGPYPCFGEHSRAPEVS